MFLPRVSATESCLRSNQIEQSANLGSQIRNQKTLFIARTNHSIKTMKVVSRKSFAAICLVAVVFLSTSVSAHYGRGHALARRAYDYHRRSPSMDLMSDMFSIPVYFNSLLKQQQEQASLRVLSDPSYHVEELSNGEIELSIDLPGVSAADLNVELLEDGTVLRVSGTRRHRESVEEFDKMFRLNKDVDADNFSVRLSDGVLRIVAPKKEKIVRKIPITVENEEKILDVDAKVVSDNKDENDNVDGESQEKDGMTITTEE